MINKIILVLSVILFSGFLHQDDNITVWMIGDSTMSIKAENKFPETGWGEPFADFFKDSVHVKNLAANGRSTKSFRNEGRWDEVLNNGKRGDFVIVQFGHNDEKVHKLETGAKIPEYKANLARYVLEARELGIIPILMTPIARRHFDEKELQDTHGEYPDAVRKIADSLDVDFIDMTALTTKMLQSYGVEKSKDLFLHLPKGDANYPEGIEDNTHLNRNGAKKIAEIVSQQLREQNIELSNYLK